MKKIVAIDFGLKRTGLAITDDLNMFAFGLDTVDSKALMTKLTELVQHESVGTFVLGMPKRLDGTDAHVTENVRLLKSALDETFKGVETILLDERFTSKMASQSMHMAGATRNQKKQKGLVDKVSATIILQSYLQQNSI